MKALVAALVMMAGAANAQVCFGTQTGCPPLAPSSIGNVSSNLPYLEVLAPSQTIQLGLFRQVSFTTVSQASSAEVSATFNTTTSVFTPTQAGTYLISVNLAGAPIGGTLSGTVPTPYMRKNGSLLNQCFYGGLIGAGPITLTCQALTYMNGTTDNVDVWFNSSGNQVIFRFPYDTINKFTAVRIGS